MENNFDNVPDSTDVSTATEQDAPNTLYADPNGAAYTQQQEGCQNTNYQQQNTGYQQQEGYQNTNYQQQYQDNYSYNTGNNTGYAKEYSVEADNAPISLGEWILILLLMSIPCVNIILCVGIWKAGEYHEAQFLPRTADLRCDRGSAVAYYGVRHDGCDRDRLLQLLLKS